VNLRNVAASLTSGAVLVAVLGAPAAMAFDKKDADMVVGRASTVERDIDTWCSAKSIRRIWIEGFSTVYLKGTKCDRLDLHIEGSSTLCMTGTYVKLLGGVVEGSSTVQVAEGLVKKSVLQVKSTSTYHVNGRGKFVCGAFGLIGG